MKLNPHLSWLDFLTYQGQTSPPQHSECMTQSVNVCPFVCSNFLQLLLSHSCSLLNVCPVIMYPEMLESSMFLLNLFLKEISESSDLLQPSIDT